MSKFRVPLALYKNIHINGDESMKDICKEILNQDICNDEDDSKINAKLALCVKMYERALKGDCRYMTMLTNIIGEMPMSDSDKTVIVPMLVNNIPNNG